MSSQRTNIIKLIIHCSSFTGPPDGTLITIYWETHLSSVTLKRVLKSLLIDLAPSPKHINDNCYFPFVRHIPNSSINNGVLIFSLSMWSCKFCVALKCFFFFFFNVTPRLTAGGRLIKWGKNTQFRYQLAFISVVTSPHSVSKPLSLQIPVNHLAEKCQQGNTVLQLQKIEILFFFVPPLCFIFTLTMKISLQALSVTQPVF